MGRVVIPRLTSIRALKKPNFMLVDIHVPRITLSIVYQSKFFLLHLFISNFMVAFIILSKPFTMMFPCGRLSTIQGLAEFH